MLRCLWANDVNSSWLNSISNGNLIHFDFPSFVWDIRQWIISRFAISKLIFSVVLFANANRTVCLKKRRKNGCVNCYHDVLFAALCVYSFLFANCERKESKRNGKMGSVQYDYDGPTHRSPAMEKTRILFILPKITPFCQIICKYVCCVYAVCSVPIADDDFWPLIK